MTDKNGNQSDTQVETVRSALAEYTDSHPDAQIDVRRQNPVSIRIRIIDPSFAGMTRVDREPPVWKLLQTLPEDVFACVTMLLLITPSEVPTSFANMEFDDPVPSRL